MTFQPPPPPPPPPAGPPPGGQPPGAWGPPPGGAPRPAFNAAAVNPLDWGILGAALLAFIFSFVSYYTGSVDTSGNCGPYGNIGGDYGSASAWHGFFGWFAVLCAIAGAALVAMDIFAPQVRMPMPARLLGLGLFAVATLCVILALFITPGPSDQSYSAGGCTITAGVGHGFGYWISLIVIIAGLVLSLMRFQQSGGKLPGALANIPDIGSRGPGGRPPAGPGGPGVPPAGGPGAPPAGGYAQPPVGGYAPPPPAGPPPGYGPPPPQ